MSLKSLIFLSKYVPKITEYFILLPKITFMINHHIPNSGPPLSFLLSQFLENISKRLLKTYPIINNCTVTLSLQGTLSFNS